MNVKKLLLLVCILLYNSYLLKIKKIFLGNGPSAIVLSYILSGHVPYWNGCPVSNDYLNIKLEQYVKDTSLLEQVSIIK